MTFVITGERVAVTGATGYVGSVLVPRLRERNDVHVFARDGAAARSLLGLPGDQVHTDLESPGAIADAFERIAPTVVFHLATHYERKDDSANVARMVDANVRFGSLVLDVASKLSKCDVVVTGSHFQFAGRERRSASFYAATKNALGEIARYLQEARGLRWIQPVLFDVYGPGDTRPKLINILIDRVSAGEPVSLPDPEPLHHFVYIDDVITALAASVQQLRSDSTADGRSLFVTSEALLSPTAVLKEVSAALGIDPIVSSQHFDLPPRSIMTPFEGPRPDGWHPRVGIRDGIERILDTVDRR